ncbi:MAG: isoleucine--tRNA ligase [Patescibacteria group bacterium]
MSEQQSRERTSFPAMEEDVLKFWNEATIFAKSLSKPAPRGEYVFYDGPPFATGTPHYGHLVGSIMKDVIPRYQTMKGYHVDRKWGWDCHGLPIENIVEKELGTKTKKEIEELGVAKFNDLCRARVSTYIDEWKTVINRLGRWADMENSYRTMDLPYMETIWWGLKELWNKDLIYKAYRSMHICPRCETTLSQSEVSEGYKDIKDLSAIAKFELIDEPGTYVLAWTTTPWTLIGNVALAVGAEIDYVKIESGEIKFILAKERLASVMKETAYEIISEFKGSELVGKAYKPLFDYYATDEKLENRENGWKIYAAEFVTTTDGTGVVHIAPAFGEDDMNLGKANNLPFIQHVGMDGMFKAEVTDFQGLHVKPVEDHMTTDIEIIKYLAGHSTLFHKEKYEHSYPHCWRCDTPLINYATSSWFIAVNKIKDQLLESAKEINWSPDYLKNGRFGNWLEGARDWSISRQRFWASAIPIWECACGHQQMIGSVAELEQLSGVTGITDIHKDKVDPITIPCTECGGTMKRISDVIDCWFESGSMPYAQLHYPFENKEKFENNFPAQFIAEGVDQCRTWFYYLHVVSGGLQGKHAFSNVIANGIVLAEDGKKMSKKLKNYPDPSLVMDKYGSDALRAYLLSSPVMLAENLNFSEKGVEESLRKNIMILWNVYKFYEMYAEGVTGEVITPASTNAIDTWIIAKLKLLNKEVTDSLEAYNLPKATRPITEFVDELSTWYLRRSRDRFKDEGDDKNQVLITLRYVLVELSKVMAPAMPFMAENLWQKVTGHNFADQNKSIHLEAWSELGELNDSEKAVLANMELVRKIVELGLASRDESFVKIRQMLGSMTVMSKEVILADEYLELIKDELNIQKVIWETGEHDYPAVALNTTITPELKKEGIKRELVRLINNLRKDLALTLADTAIVSISGANEEIVEVIKEKGEDIKKDTLSSALEIVGEKIENSKEVKIDDCKFNIFLKRS